MHHSISQKKFNPLRQMNTNLFNLQKELKQKSLNYTVMNNTLKYQNSPYYLPCSLEHFWHDKKFEDLSTRRNRNMKCRQNPINNNKEQKYVNKLTLDDSVCQDNQQFICNVNKNKSNNTNKQHKFNKTTKIQPTNPFQEILMQNDTPDFNINFPFVDQFSKIDLKSPTFSDIFNNSQQKSPEINYQNKMFFISTKKQINDVQSKNNQMNKKPQIDVNKSLIKTTQTSYKKLTSGYKLKNHFNQTTPKLQKIDELFINKSKQKTSLYKTSTKQLKQYKKQVQNKIQQSLLSQFSNPEEERMVFDDLTKRINLFTVNKNTKFNEEKQNNWSDKKNTNIYNFKLNKQNDKMNQTSFSKSNQSTLEEEMQDIYNGKFKLQRTTKHIRF